MDSRTPFNKDTELILGDTVYVIGELIGYGSNAFVYSAAYRDNLQPDKAHTVLIKELFPYHPGGSIERGDDGRIICHEEAAELYELHKNSFLRGNAAHLDFSDIRADMASVNINSYEANGTLYTVIGNSNGETLQSAAKRGEVAASLRDVVVCLIGVLDALDVFHKNGLLHLDLSPDNILLLPPEGGRSYHRVMLIDYNSVWNVDEINGLDGACFSVKENYSAPEVRLQDKSAVSAASDLFSVCAIFLEFLRGQPLDFTALYSGEKITADDAQLLKGVPEAVAMTALAIVKKGLRFSPGRRYQSVLELRVDLIDLLDGLSRIKRKRTVIIAVAGILLIAALTFGAVRAADYLTASYPKTQQEIYAAENIMTELADSLGMLGRQIDSDLKLLSGVAERTDSAPLRDEGYSEDDVRAILGSRSPIPLSTLTELLNAPEDYAEWSDVMRECLSAVLGDESVYPEDDKTAIIGLYKEYISSYASVCYIKLQLVIQPLNAEGKKPILNALPYIHVFGDKFITQPFITDKAELNSVLEAENVKTRDIIARLKSYGL